MLLFKRFLQIFFLVTLSLGHYVTISFAYPREALLYPCLGCPVIQSRGQAITIVVDSATVRSIDRAWLVSSNDPVSIEVELTDLKKLTNQSSQYSVTIPGKFPDGQFVPEDLYDLFIQAGEKEFFQPNAVKVVRTIKEKFSFVHLTDTHIKGYDPQNISKYPHIKRLLLTLAEIKILNPDFILLTGDVTDGMQPFNYVAIEQSTIGETGLLYPALWNLWSTKCNVVTFMLPGNHDCHTCTMDGQILDGSQYWQEWVGPLYYSFNYGSWRFTCLWGNDWPMEDRDIINPQNREAEEGWTDQMNWAWRGGYTAAQLRLQQLGWLKRDLAIAESRGENIVVAIHQNPYYFKDFITSPFFDWSGEGQEELLELIEEYKVKMVNSGHIHYDHYGEVKDTKYVAATTCSAHIGNKGHYYGYRLIEIDGDKITQVNYPYSHGSIPSGKIKYEFENEDNGQFKENTFTIESELDENFPVYVEFYMPKPEAGYKYQIMDGEEFQPHLKWKDYEIYYVVSRVEPGGEREVRIEQVVE